MSAGFRFANSKKPQNLQRITQANPHRKEGGSWGGDESVDYAKDVKNTLIKRCVIVPPPHHEIAFQKGGKPPMKIPHEDFRGGRKGENSPCKS